MAVHNSLLWTTSTVVGGAFLTLTPGSAADAIAWKATPAPAADGVTWKIDGLGGSFADRALYGGRGSVTVPLNNLWGFQVDGGLGTFDQRFFGAVGGHLFWRDPARALLGVYVNYTHWKQLGGLHVTQIAGEGEAYWGRWTLQGIAGVETSNSATQTTTTLVVGNPLDTAIAVTDSYGGGTRFFDQINLAYYVNDDWKAYLGHRYLGGKHAVALGSEFGFAMGGGKMAALFVEGRVGEGDHRGIWGGLRFYFGQKDKPLIRRHREDDPWTDWIPASLLSITNQFGSSVRTWTCPTGECTF
jgi:hypothetical protein